MPKVNVKVPNLNGFDKSFKHLATAKCGTLVPLLCDELPASTKVHLKSALMAQLPPLATDTFMRVNLKMEAFFVPTRLLYGGYPSWLTREKLRIPQRPNEDLYARLPVLTVQQTAEESVCAPGSLLDYLGCHAVRGGGPVTTSQFNIFPLLAYHRIYDDWYRNPNVQSPVFTKPLVFGETGTVHIYDLPYITFDSSATTPTAFTVNAQLADGVKLGDLRQRNFGYDYFTNALPSPQRGDAQKVVIDTEDNSFTIASLRAANSLQQFAERNELAGPRWQDFLKANYNADLSDGVAQRAIYLGSGEVAVYNKSVIATAANAVAVSQTPNQNPFAGPTQGIGQGAKFGDASASGQISLVDNFVTNEPGYLMVMCSLVPVVTYGSGINRMFFRNNADDSQPDMVTPILQNVGNQPIYQGELTGKINRGVFGYTDRYADFKYKNDELSGLVRDGENLQAFALQRVLDGNPEISDEFLQIPTDFMDQITVVDAWISNFGYWVDAFFDYKVAMPLDSYSLPSLQDPAYEHGQNVVIDTNGSQVR